MLEKVSSLYSSYVDKTVSEILSSVTNFILNQDHYLGISAPIKSVKSGVESKERVKHTYRY